MRIRHQLSYDAPVQAVYAMLGDAEFRSRVCEAMDVASKDVSIRPTHGGGMQVRIDMLQRTVGLPGFASRVVGDRTRVIQSEAWSVSDGGGRVADLDLQIPGRPGHIRGGITLGQRGTSTVESFDGEVVVRLPLVGGRVEKLVEKLFVEGMDTEQRLGARWLSGDHR